MTTRRTYQTLDAIVVVAVLVILGGVFWSLVFRDIPQSNLPILSGLAGTLFGGTVATYAAMRWGSKKADDVDLTVKPPA